MPTILVTGANRGIGLELARQLHARGDRVIAACRTTSPELSALGATIEAGVDVTDDDAVRRLAQRLEGTTLDLLVNNAGVLTTEKLDALDFDAIRRQFEINALGPLRVTAALLPRLRSGSRVALITSRMGSIADNGSGGTYGYRMSKAALNMAGVSLARDLEKRGIAVGIYHPGMVATDMTSRFGHHGPQVQTAADAAKKLIERFDELTLARTGGFWHASGETLPW
jgi:NAD(P)-dependent dehydrogenase (short-subunit alcohol dehydrogenase family)